MSSPVFSASQVSTYEMCPRKWAFQKIDNLPSPPNKYAEMGTKVHEALETWLIATKLPEGEALPAVIARAMIPFLPPPQAVSEANVERAFTWSSAGVAFRGFMDLVVPSVENCTIYDHKTTSDLSWAKTPEDLAEDVQATLYARVMMDELRLDHADLQWTYATRKPKPNVQPVRLRVLRDDIEPRVSRTVESAKEMKLILESGCTAADVPYDASACQAFGGCPFQTNCNLTPQQRIQSIMSQETSKSSFLQRLQARKAQGPATAAPAPAAATAAFAVNPPEAEHVEVARVVAEAMAEVPVAPPAAPVAEAPVKRGPGRPRKDATVAAPAPVAPAPTVAFEAPAPRTAPVAAPVSAALPVSGWTLYINCAPIKGPEVVGAGEYRWAPRLENIAPRIERVMREFTAETGLTHYRLAEYGKGPALFAEGFARDLAENPPKGDVMVDIASQEVRDVLQVLMAAAQSVVRGFGN